MSGDNSDEDFYKILKCDQTASYNELKQSYQNLVKQHHPDKQENDVENRQSDDFLKIDKAWKILRDAGLRKSYDASLLHVTVEKEPLIYCTLYKSDITLTNDMFSYPCRCGESFDIDRECLNETECIIECSQCSNCIVIK